MTVLIKSLLLSLAMALSSHTALADAEENIPFQEAKQAFMDARMVSQVLEIETIAVENFTIVQSLSLALFVGNIFNALLTPFRLDDKYGYQRYSL